jgi:DNA-binding phage protein
MSTNRFGLPLCVIAGVNEFNQTVVFAVALTSHQNEEAFSWILNEMRRIVGDDSWKQVKTIFTDGDKAMSKAIRVQMPHVFHRRCIFHLKMNIRQNLTKVMSDADVESYIADWILVVCLERDETKFIEQKKRLATKYPASVDYMNKNIWTIEQSFAYCFTHSMTTLGIKSTQRIESFNAKVRHSLQLDSATEVRVGIPRIVQSVDDTSRAAIEAWRKLKEKPMTVDQMGSWDNELIVHCTPMAEAWIRREHEFSDNYSAFFNQHSKEWTVQISQQVRERYTAIFTQYDQETREWLLKSAQEYRLIKLTTESDQEEKKQVETKWTKDHQMFFFFYALIDEPIRAVGELESDKVSCSCGSVNQMLLPCRHVVAANRAMQPNQPFRIEQIIARWKHTFMPSVDSFDEAKQMRSPSELQALPEFKLSQLLDEEKEQWIHLEQTIERVKKVARLATDLAGRACGALHSWLRTELQNNPRLTTIVGDPPAKSKTKSSTSSNKKPERRIMSKGEPGASSAGTRKATADDIERFKKQRTDTVTQSQTMRQTEMQEDNDDTDEWLID